MKVTARETVFFHTLHGQLCQKVEVMVDLAQPSRIEVIIDAGCKGMRTTTFEGMGAGRQVLSCFAPVVYPNLVNGRHLPISAQLTVRVDGEIFEGMVTLGRHRPWTIYVMQDICTDFTWGMADEETKVESYRFTLAHLDQMDRTDGWAEDERHRWNLNQTMEIEWFLEQANDDDRVRFFRRVKEGRLKLSATYNVNLSAIMPVEQAIRSLYYARELERKYGIAFDTVEHIEMPSMAWGMLEVYASSGIRRFAKSWLNYNSQYLRKQSEKPLFRWKTPDGASLLALMPRSANLKYGYAQGGFLIEKSPDEAAKELHGWWIPCYEGMKDYPLDCIPIMGAYCDLNISARTKIPRLVEAIRAYNANDWDYPRLVNATWDMYFDAAERSAESLGAAIPELGGDFGVSWEDWPIHYAHVAATMKRGIANMFALERLAAAADAVKGQSDATRKAILDRSMLLMERLAEHPWNGTDDEERWRSYEKRLGWAQELVSCNQRLLELLSGEGELCVYNPVCRPREDYAVFGLNNAPQGAQIIAGGDAVMAVSAPAMGMTPCKASPMLSGAVKAEGFTLENAFYRIEISAVSGGIISLIDKRTGRQWASDEGLNTLLYVSDNVPLYGSCVSVEVEENGPVTAALKIRMICPLCEVETIIRLNAVNDRIDVINRLHKQPSSEPLNLYFSFPFLADERQYHYEGGASILRPGLVDCGGDMLPGAGQEIYAAQDFVDMNVGGGGVILCPLDSYMFQFGGNGYELLPDGPLQGGPAVLALCLTNHSYNEILRDQYGNEDFLFRFSLKSYDGDYDEERAVRFGREAANPLVPMRAGTMLSGFIGRSIVKVHTPGVFITALKPAEEGGGAIVLRFWNASSQPVEAQFDVSALDMKVAEEVDLLERRSSRYISFEGGIVSLSVRGQGFGAILLSK